MMMMKMMMMMMMMTTTTTTAMMMIVVAEKLMITTWSGSKGSCCLGSADAWDSGAAMARSSRMLNAEKEEHLSKPMAQARRVKLVVASAAGLRRQRLQRRLKKKPDT